MPNQDPEQMCDVRMRARVKSGVKGGLPLGGSKRSNAILLAKGVIMLANKGGMMAQATIYAGAGFTAQEKAEAILNDLGLNLSTYIRMMVA